MNKIVCEMCGSAELLKKDGVFVCQHCGLQYSADDVKKMMIEGTVEVKGTVEVDQSGFVARSLANARRAKDKTDWEEVEKYYNLVEQHEPHNIEAIFYSSYGKAMQSLIDNQRYKREQIFTVFEKSISVIDDYYDPEKSSELEELIAGMSSDLLDMFKSKFVYSTAKNDPLGGMTSVYQSFANVEVQFIESLENIVDKDEKISYYELLAVHYARCIGNKYVRERMRKTYRERFKEAVRRIKENNPDYKEPRIQEIDQVGTILCIGCLAILAFFTLMIIIPILIK